MNLLQKQGNIEWAILSHVPFILLSTLLIVVPVLSPTTQKLASLLKSTIAHLVEVMSCSWDGSISSSLGGQYFGSYWLVLVLSLVLVLVLVVVVVVVQVEQ